jgi:integrase
MANILLSFGFKNEKFSLCATKKGTTTRHYKVVSELINPNFKYWDSKKQCFQQPSEDAICNNQTLLRMKSHYQQIIDISDPQDGKELFELATKAVKIEAKKEITLGEYLNKLIYNMRNATGQQAPSCNYQCYTTLLNKLKCESEIINVALSQIDDDYYEAFSKFIINKLNGVNYLPLMKTFKTTINKAKEDKLTKQSLSFPYRKHAPRKQTDIIKATKSVAALSEKEYNKFITMDLNKIPFGGDKPKYYKELYRDFCIFLYEMKLRPCDVIALHSDNIHNGRIIYVPTKKKNYSKLDIAFVSAPITPKAQSIIDKYKGVSICGYIIPFTMNNECKWNLDNANSFNKWYYRRQGTLERINKFLKKVHKAIKPNDIDSFTTYVFRRTAITHEIKANNKPLIQIAKEAGTSVMMLEKHYYNYIQQ